MRFSLASPLKRSGSLPTGEGGGRGHLSMVCPTLAGLYIVPYGLTTASNWLSTNRRPMFSAKQEPTNRSLSVGLILKDDFGIFTLVCSSISLRSHYYNKRTPPRGAGGSTPTHLQSLLAQCHIHETGVCILRISVENLPDTSSSIGILCHHIERAATASTRELIAET